MVTEQEADALQRQTLEKLAEFRKATIAYMHGTGRSPQFILGNDVPEIAIPPASLVNCRVLGDRQAIIRDMPDRGNVVEVGTQTGRFAQFILTQCPNVRLFTIDIDYSNFERDALEPFVRGQRLTTIEGCSWEELAKFPEGFFSWIYIDASHFLDNIRRDLAVAKTRVRVGGHLICNDYTTWSPFEAVPYGVVTAVNELLWQEDFEVTHFAFHPFGYHDIALLRRS